MVKLTAISRIGDNGTSIFFNEMDAEVFFSRIENNENSFDAKLFDKGKNLVSNIYYRCSRSSVPREYLLHDSHADFLFICSEDPRMLVCRDSSMVLKRGFFDKSFKLFTGGKLLVKAKTFNFFRDYVRAKYYIEILDDKRITFCCSVCLIYFILVFESATNTQRNNMGGFGNMHAR